MNHCLASSNYVNVIVADKQVHLQYLDMESAVSHCTKGIGIWDWCSNSEGVEPDVVMACCGDTSTQESLAATGENDIAVVGKRSSTDSRSATATLSSGPEDSIRQRR